MYQAEIELYLAGAGVKQLGWKNGFPARRSCTISGEGGKDPLRQLRMLVHIYLVDMDFYGS